MRRRLCKNGLIQRLRRLERGTLRLTDGGTDELFGRSSNAAESANLIVRDPRFYTSLAFQGTLGAAEAYLEDWWATDDLVALFRLLAKNENVLSDVDSGVARLFRSVNAWAHRLRRNTIAGSRRHVGAHYDLGNEFYALFLDDTMTYSSGIFQHPEATMRDASLAKYDRICRKLELSPHDHLLEIGTGWGGFAMHAARNFGCRVTTTTVSRQQFDYASRKVVEAGLAGKVTVLCQDYRKLSGEFAKLASIEMIEAVGHEFLDSYFRKCSALLKPNGLMVLQSITIPDHRHESYRRSVDFIQKYVFPGGCLPSFCSMANSLRRVTDFRVLHAEDFGCHYAETLLRWRAQFRENIDLVHQLGFDERFIRMWNYYLCYCEAGFLDNHIGVCQLVLAKPDCQRTPIL